LVVGCLNKKKRKKTKLQRMEITRMAMEVGMGALMGVLMAEASPKVGVRNTKSQSIAITQKGSLRKHIAKEERR
jgi:hypothetical protein